MARATDLLLDGTAQATWNALESNAKRPAILNAEYGGQFGFVPRYDQLLSSTPYIPQNVIPIVLEYPKMFSKLPNSDKWIKQLKTIMEAHSKKIEGLKDGMEAEFSETDFGAAGQKFHQVTDMKTPVSEIEITFNELAGMPIQRLLRTWMRLGMMDPNSKHPGIISVSGFNKDEITDWLPDWYTMSMIFIEPDPLHQTAVKTWVCANMMPENMGEVIGVKDKLSAREPLELVIPFKSISQFTEGTNVLGQKILDAINTLHADPYLQPSFIQEIHADLAAAKQGYKESVENLASTAVKQI